MGTPTPQENYRPSRLGEMAQSVKHLLGKHEDLSSTPSTQVRKLVWWHINPSTGEADVASLDSLASEPGVIIKPQVSVRHHEKTS